MFDGSTEDLPSYIPGYEEWLEEREQETDYGSYDAYDEYIDNLIDEQKLGEKEEEKKEREEEKENDEQKRKKTI